MHSPIEQFATRQEFFLILQCSAGFYASHLGLSFAALLTFVPTLPRRDGTWFSGGWLPCFFGQFALYLRLNSRLRGYRCAATPA
jgi:hypothetical protein